MSDAILVFDHSAILESDSHFWQGVSDLGVCWIPQVVLEEVNFIVAGMGNKSQEAIASEFQRFFRSSNWQISDVVGNDPRLSQKLGSALSRNARLDLATAECIFGMALQSTEPIILITNTQALAQAVNDLNQPNLRAVTGAIAKTWIQNRHISLKSSSLKVTSRAETVRNTNYARLNKLMVTIIGWIMIVSLGLIVWRSLQPREFKQFWQKTGLPNFIKN